MTKVFHRTFFLKGPAGKLEALLWTSPKASPAMAAVVCHPHPLFGGTMHNKVVFQVAKTLHGLGLPVLRFNFRGAGLSEGAHDKGKGEGGDVRAGHGAPDSVRIPDVGRNEIGRTRPAFGAMPGDPRDIVALAE